MWFVLSWFSGTGNGMVWHEATPMCLATTAGTTWWCQRFEGQFLWNLVNRFDSYMDSRPLKWIIIIQNEQIHGQTRVPWDVYMYYINNMIPMINMVLRRNLAMAMTQVPTQLFLSLSLSRLHMFNFGRLSLGTLSNCGRLNKSLSMTPSVTASAA